MTHSPKIAKFLTVDDQEGGEVFSLGYNIVLSSELEEFVSECSKVFEKPKDEILFMLFQLGVEQLRPKVEKGKKQWSDFIGEDS